MYLPYIQQYCTIGRNNQLSGFLISTYMLNCIWSIPMFWMLFSSLGFFSSVLLNWQDQTKDTFIGQTERTKWFIELTCRHSSWPSFSPSSSLGSKIIRIRNSSTRCCLEDLLPSAYLIILIELNILELADDAKVAVEQNTLRGS